jgi:chromate transport protein ChrA
MTLPFGRARSLVLVALPAASFLVGPIVASIGYGDGDVVTLSVLPTVLPAVALLGIAVEVYRQTKSGRVVAAFVSGAMALLLVTAAVWLLSAVRRLSLRRLMRTQCVATATHTTQRNTDDGSADGGNVCAGSIPAASILRFRGRWGHLPA